MLLVRIILIRTIWYGTFSHGNKGATKRMSAVSTTPIEQASDRRRWIALVVLCLGFLMIILDQTIVNVALPSIQHDLHFSQSGLAWVINAYLIAFGGLLLLVGTTRRPRRTPADLPERAGPVHARVAGVRRLRQPGDAGRRTVRPGNRRCDDLGRDPRDDRDDVPGAAGARARRSASTRSSPRPAARSACWPAACSPRR